MKPAILPIGSILPAIAGPLLQHPNAALYRLRRGWGDVVGDPLKHHSHPLRLSDGRLIVAVESSAWMMQLTFYQTQILEKIAQEFTGCTIREIRWQLSRTGKTATPPDQAKRPLPAATMEEMAKAQTITAGIQDPELGTILRRLICKRLVLERMGEQTVMKSPPQDP